MNCCVDGQKKYLDANKLLLSLINWHKDSDLGTVMVEMANYFTEHYPLYIKQKYSVEAEYQKYFFFKFKN